MRLYYHQKLATSFLSCVFAELLLKLVAMSSPTLARVVVAASAAATAAVVVVVWASDVDADADDVLFLRKFIIEERLGMPKPKFK